MKTPEEYFLESVTPPEEGGAGSGAQANTTAPDGAEAAFIRKYLGMDPGAAQSAVPRMDPRAGEVAMGATGVDAATGHDPEAALQRMEEVQLVSFFVGSQELALPITAIQEVVRRLEPTKLPASPQYVLGVINLRGRITPMVSTRQLVGAKGTDDDDRFTVICRRSDMQLGLNVSQIASTYHVGQADIEWGIDSQVGVEAGCLSGLMKRDGKLIAILSVDRLVQRIMA